MYIYSLNLFQNLMYPIYQLVVLTPKRNTKIFVPQQILIAEGLTEKSNEYNTSPRATSNAPLSPTKPHATYPSRQEHAKPGPEGRLQSPSISLFHESKDSVYRNNWLVKHIYTLK